MKSLRDKMIPNAEIHDALDAWLQHGFKGITPQQQAILTALRELIVEPDLIVIFP
jgi:hypothetical protein